jgi:hypothetical protein
MLDMTGTVCISIASNIPPATARSALAVIRVYDAGGNLIEAHEHNGDFIE